MRPERAALYAILAAFLASWIATVGHIVLDSRPELAYPKPLYRNWDYVGSAAGADFGQIYFASKAWLAGENPYGKRTDENRDPLNRPMAYPPFTVMLLSPLSRLPFPQALLTHLAAEIGLFLLVFLALPGPPLRSRASALALFMATLIFTPVGVTFLQQAQFDLYTAAAYLLCIAGLRASSRTRFVLYALAGPLLALKWTGLPLLAFLTLWDLRTRCTFAPLVAWVILGATCLLPGTEEYLRLIPLWERQNAAGISFHYISEMLGLPGWSVLALYGVLLLAAVEIGRHAGERGLFAVLSPIAIFSLGLGHMAFEYRSLALFGVIGAMVLRSENEPLRPFLVFSLIAFRLFPLGGIDEFWYAIFYFVAAIALFGLGIRISQRARNETAAT